MEFNLRGGVLIIGSLFWQDDLKPERNDQIRKKWRDEHLNMAESNNVLVPIRYGRLSGSEKKGNVIYTMVFDNSLPESNYGIAKVVPFKNEIVKNWIEIEKEAKEMSKAEGEGEYFIKGMTGWCVCAIIFNPKLSLEKQSFILDEWANSIKENVEGFGFFSQNRDRYNVDENGKLLLKWPKYANEFDFLIATSTKAEANLSEITPKEIVKYIDNREYFIPNTEVGISTFQDKEIKELL